MDILVGQDAFRAPSVFSFFEPDFSPDGVVADEGLAAPEAQLGTSPLTIGYLNGMDSLIEHGLTSCFYGFGVNAITAAKIYFCTLSDGVVEVTLNNTRGDPGALIDEISTLLTPGRLSSNTRAVMTETYANTTVNDTEALQRLLKLFVIAPGFHSTNKTATKKISRKKSVKIIES